MSQGNIVISNKFINDHNFSVTEANKSFFRKFQIHQNFVKTEYKNSFYIDLPEKMGLDLLKFKGNNIDPKIKPQVKILIGKKLIHNLKTLKERDEQKWSEVKEKSLQDNSWKWKKMTTIVSIRPSFLFTVHIFDKKTNQKLEDESGQKIDYETAFRLLETLEISHAKHFKTAVHLDEPKLKTKTNFDLVRHVYTLILTKQFDNDFLLKNSQIINSYEIEQKPINKQDSFFDEDWEQIEAEELEFS